MMLRLGRWDRAAAAGGRARRRPATQAALRRRRGAVPGRLDGLAQRPRGARDRRGARRAIRADKIHNRWGLPGHFVGRSGSDLLSIKHGVEDALRPLLDDTRPLSIDGSEAATLADTAGYRVADLAGYLLATKRGETWTDDIDPAVRDASTPAPAPLDPRAMGDPGFEPGTSSLSEKRSNRLS